MGVVSAALLGVGEIEVMWARGLRARLTKGEEGSTLRGDRGGRQLPLRWNVEFGGQLQESRGGARAGPIGATAFPAFPGPGDLVFSLFWVFLFWVGEFPGLSRQRQGEGGRCSVVSCAVRHRAGLVCAVPCASIGPTGGPTGGGPLRWHPYPCHDSSKSAVGR